MAPEFYEDGDVQYGTPVDIYAFGMSVLEMITRERPYKECGNVGQIYMRVKDGSKPQSFTRIQDEEVQEFIAQCIDKDPNKRPSATELINSDFLTNLGDSKNKEPVQVAKASEKKKHKSPLNLQRKAASLPNEEDPYESLPSAANQRSPQFEEECKSPREGSCRISFAPSQFEHSDSV